MLGSDPGTDELRGQLVDFEAGREPLPALRADTDRIAGTVIGETIWIGAADGSLQRSDGSGWVTVDLDAHDPWFY